MEKNFDKVIELINVLNRLYDGIRDCDRFSYHVERGHMYIKGIACDLASLYNLLWAECYGYSFTLSWSEGHTILECY